MAEVAKDGTSSDNIVQPAVYNNLDTAPKGADTVANYKAPTVPEGQEPADEPAEVPAEVEVKDAPAEKPAEKTADKTDTKEGK